MNPQLIFLSSSLIWSGPINYSWAQSSVGQQSTRSNPSVESKSKLSSSPLSAASKGKSVAQPREAIKALKAAKPRGMGALGYFEAQGTAEGKTESELVDMIKGFRLLIDAEAPSLKRNNYLLGEASGYLALARLYRVKSEMREKDQEREQTSNRRALKNTGEVFSSSHATGEQQAKALYFGGLAQINLGDYEAARKSFLQSLQLNPKASQAPLMNLFVSENLFEAEKYEEALKQYGRYYKQYNNPQKALAIYKMGWSYLNLGRTPSAERMLLLLAGQRWAGSFGDDSVKDLAFIASLFRTEDQAIEFAAQNFSKNLELRVRYLTELFLYFANQSSTKKKPILLAEILHLEKDPIKRLGVLIANLRSSQKGFASVEPMNDFLRLHNELTDLKMGPDKPGFDKIGPEYEAEILKLIKAYGDSFFGKVQGPEKISAEEVGQKLSYLLRQHLKLFPKSSENRNSYEALLATCRQIKDMLCIYEISHEILKKLKDSDLLVQANLDLIRALDVLVQEQSQYRNEYVQRLTEFLETFPQDPNWLNFARRLSVLLNEQKSYNESLPWLQKIAQKDSSVESIYRLAWVRFELGQFDEVARTVSEMNSGPFGQDLKVLVREANLKMAERAQLEGREEEYEKHLKEFIRLSDDPRKIQVARQNFISGLVQKKKYSQLESEMNALSAQERVSEAFAPYSLVLVRHLLVQAHYEKAISFFAQQLSTAQSGLQLEQGLALLLNDQKLKFFELRSRMKSETQFYLDGLLALGNPEILVQFYDKILPKTEEQKQTLYLALQVQQKKSQPDLPKKWASLLGVFVKQSGLKGTSRLLRDYMAMEFPKSRWSLQRYEKAAQDVVSKVRRARARVIQELEGRSVLEKKEILEKAQASENRTQEMILQSPLPAGLSEIQVQEYRKGLQSLAQEFADQAIEFGRILQNMEEQVKAFEAQALKIPNPTLWPWPNRVESSNIQKLVAQNRTAAALGLIEQMKMDGLLNAEEAALLRVGALLQAQPHQVMVDYLAAELTAAGQNSVLEKWRGLGK